MEALDVSLRDSDTVYNVAITAILPKRAEIDILNNRSTGNDISKNFMD